MWNPFAILRKSNRVRKLSERLLASGLLRRSAPLSFAYESRSVDAFDVPNDTLTSDGERSVMRSRCKREFLRDAYARNTARSFALAVYGTGPKLQVHSGNEDVDSRIEWLFQRWRKKVRMDWKWHVALNALFYDGEAFFHFFEHARVPGGYSLELIEARRISDRYGATMDPYTLEGITYDTCGDPVSYLVQDQYINPTYDSGMTFTSVPAARMYHFFLDDLTCQRRGLPLLHSVLGTLDGLHRVSMASLDTWELAARLNLFLKTNIEASDLYAVLPQCSGDDGQLKTADTLKAFDEMPLPDNGWAMMLPNGMEPAQIDSKHPSQNYSENKKSYLSEVGAGVCQPRNVVTCDSSDYNFSSAKLDNQIFGRWAKTCQEHVADGLHRMLEVAVVPLYNIEPAVQFLLDKYDPADIPVDWHFGEFLSNIDRAQDADADMKLVTNNLETIKDYCARHGKDWRQHIEQRNKEREMLGQTVESEVTIDAAE